MSDLVTSGVHIGYTEIATGDFYSDIDLTGLVIDDDFSLGIDSETDTADDGSLILYGREIKYREIDLIGGSDWGWLTLAHLRALQDLGKVLDSTYELFYEGTVLSVRFRTEDIPTISGEKIIIRSNQETTDYYNNIILKLMEV